MKPGTASPWETSPAHSGGWVSIRCEHRRRRGVAWVVVSHDSPTPAEGFARGDLRVHYAAHDGAGARDVARGMWTPG